MLSERGICAIISARDPQRGKAAAVSGRKPYTFLAPGEEAAQAFSEPALARLHELKRARDPHNLFNANFPVLD
ncbi:hypothetical protein [Kribbella sp. VKM Ac-2568]|uniref:hypothetical protein n=1 Tax=Kribbella sp. VKM Ac-2568 TaxID=2512219 RepID=UPI0018EE8FB5|nr:hypothetical protein [Kribbella sp. VKM Ac-2568]